MSERRRASGHVHYGVSEVEFVALREGRDAGLPAPKLLLRSIQETIRAGHFDKAETNGITYLRIHVRWQASESDNSP